MLEKHLIFEILGNKYVIKYPNVGEYRAIESMKQILSRGNYGNMLRSNSAQANEALDMIDAESYLSILCPKFIEDLKCDSFAQLGLFDFMAIKKEFNKQFVPWWREMESILRPETEENEQAG